MGDCLHEPVINLFCCLAAYALPQSHNLCSDISVWPLQAPLLIAFAWLPLSGCLCLAPATVFMVSLIRFLLPGHFCLASPPHAPALGPTCLANLSATFALDHYLSGTMQLPCQPVLCCLSTISSTLIWSPQRAEGCPVYLVAYLLGPQ